jgi:glycosyltransferase involved in cell wall biosynthesis
MDEITAIIPTFNRSRLVRRAIESALAQTVRPSQVIVVDDGSSDDTAEVCSRYAGRIEYVRQKNQGVSAARNQGIRLVRHPWTAFLDSDDYWAPTHLEKVSAAIAGTSGHARFYFTDMALPAESGHGTLWEKIGFQFPGPFLLEPNATDWALSQRQPCPLPCSVFRTDILRLSGGFDVRYRAMEDTELFCRTGIGGPACAVNTVGGFETADDLEHNRLTRIVHSRSESCWEHECMLWSGLLERFPDLPPEYRRGLRYSLAVAHWRLSRLHWRSLRLARSARNFVESARAQPAFLLWLLSHGRSWGWESRVFPQCRAT